MNKFLIGDFEGPLDLLLHLVKKSEMDISELSLIEITEQYINYIKTMEELNLDIASEYLVTAAELIEMKSRYLLPKPPKEETEELEIDPEEELKRRLIEYKKYKESVNSFRTLEENRGSFYTKPPEKKENYTEEKVENDGSVTAYDLLNALQKLLERKEYSKPLNTKITKKELSVADRVVKIRDILKKEKRIDFLNLFEEITKEYVVVTFLSILEMAKNKEILLSQDTNFGTIILERVD
ncbi:MAG: segregation/condensation protein A [Bacilli bacterium]|nr:segregation/condensation protein A [Bacilli bacterium]